MDGMKFRAWLHWKDRSKNQRENRLRAMAFAALAVIGAGVVLFVVGGFLQ